MTTTIANKKQQSRRRLAAITFLSNISLDGSHRDTKLGLLIRAGNHINGNGGGGGRGDGSDPVRASGDPISVEINGSGPDAINHNGSMLCIGTISESLEDDSILTDSYSDKKPSSKYDPNSGSAASSALRKKDFELRYIRNPSGKPIQDERIVFVTGQKTPMAIFSSIAFNRNKIVGRDFNLERNKRRHTSGSRPLTSIIDETSHTDILSLLGLDRTPCDGQDISFCQFLSPSNSVVVNNTAIVTTATVATSSSTQKKNPSIHHNYSFKRHNQPSLASETPQQRHPITVGSAVSLIDANDVTHSYKQLCPYNPNLLDDPELVAGKHSTILAFPSYMTSVIDYVKPSDLKKELNDKFRERFPSIQLTLSKLRSLKKEMCKIAKQDCSLDLLTVAQSYVYFERLCLRRLINKHNRKLIAGACLVLSAKLNDVKGGDLRNLIERIESGFRLNRREIIATEMGVLVALEFALHLPVSHILPHYQRLLYEA